MLQDAVAHPMYDVDSRHVDAASAKMRWRECPSLLLGGLELRLMDVFKPSQLA